MEATKDAAMRYRGFVMRNRMLMNAAESAIQGLAFLVPSTLPDHELFTEACHALSGLFATFNHFITLPQDTSSSSQADLIRSLISFTINVEVFAEKLGERFGGKNSTILAIEVLKAALRLRLLASNHETLQTNGEKLEMDKTTCTWDSYIHFCDGRRRREQQQRRAAGLPEAERVLVFTGGRSGIQLRVPASYTGAAHADVLRQQQLREKQLQQSLQYLRIGEVLHILRPVVYAALKYTISTQKTSSPRSSDQQRREEISAAAASPTSRDWIPWIVSLLMELAALYCTAMAIALAQGTKSSSSSTRTRAPHAADASQAHPFERELERRKWLLAWYLLRSPLFETGVRPLLQTALRIFGSTPLLGGLFRYITNLPEYLHRHHFYTAGSS